MDEAELVKLDLQMGGPDYGRPVGYVIARSEIVEAPEAPEDVWAAWTADESNLL